MTQAVVLFGSPGSGKGTQAHLLKDCLKVPHVSTGDMLREHIREGNALGVRVAATMQSGTLVRDELVNHLVEERLAEPDAQAGFILDGYPRTREQAEHLCGWLDGRGIRELVIHLIVDYNIIVTRLAGRRQCPRCGTLYNTVSNPPRVDGVCDLDGQALVIRDDDRESVIRQRLAEYESQSRPLIEFFREKGRRLYEIDASDQTPEALLFQVCRTIRSPEAA
ncbi:MAG TPA: nucleoside monophosphate kinase [Bryobacteraceae bacterium]|jgi:adenylate kinase|nr:nucleoside monophosphate kinase [Bryobacteraceae bacterium]